jgi:hypothetical protein
LTEIENRLKPDSALLNDDATVSDFFGYALIRDRIPASVRENVLTKLSSMQQADEAPQNETPTAIEIPKHNESAYQLDEPLILEVCRICVNNFIMFSGYGTHVSVVERK